MSGFRSVLASGPAQGLLDCGADWSWGSAFSMVPSHGCWQEVWASLHCPFVGLCECPGDKVAVSLRVVTKKRGRKKPQCLLFSSLRNNVLLFLEHAIMLSRAVWLNVARDYTEGENQEARIMDHLKAGHHDQCAFHNSQLPLGSMECGPLSRAYRTKHWKCLHMSTHTLNVHYICKWS